IPLIRLASRATLERTRIGLAFAAPFALLVGGLACKAYGQIALHLDPEGGWDPNWPSVFERSWFFQATCSRLACRPPRSPSSSSTAFCAFRRACACSP